MKIEVGDLLFVKGDCFTSKIIKFFLNSDYTHVTIAMNESDICEVDISKKMEIMKNPYVEFELYRLKRRLTDWEKERLAAFLVSKCQTSKGYDWWRLLSLGIKKYFRANLVIHEQDRYICSEIIDKAYQHIGIDLVEGRVTGDITPLDLMHSNHFEHIHSKYQISC